MTLLHGFNENNIHRKLPLEQTAKSLTAFKIALISNRLNVLSLLERIRQT